MSEAKFESAIRKRQAQEAKEKKRQARDKRSREAARARVFAAAASNNRPDVSQCDDIDIKRVIDPSEGEELVHVGKGPPLRMVNPNAKERLRVVSLRDDPVGQMARRGQLGSDAAQCNLRLAAAREWQRLHEAAEVGTLRGKDPTYEAVDGGRFTPPDSASRLDAIKQLGALSRVLGIRSENLIRRVLGQKFTVKQVVAMDGLLGGTKTAQEKILDAYLQRFRESLDDMATAFHMVAEGRGPRRERDRFDDSAHYSFSPTLHEAVQRAKRAS
jgi:hypothetical protein